jgi:Uma2 family endonuclease
MRQSAHPGRLLTYEEYLEFEERSPIRHEYVAGEVYAMAGPSTRHNTISLNIHTHLRSAARAHGCRVFVEAIKLHIGDRVYYPDVMAACGAAAEVELIVEEPSLVVEVTSPSTRATDRREKLDAYLHVSSLRHYLIVDQRRKHVLVYSRDSKGEWTREEVEGDGDIELPFLGARLTIDQIYEDVRLPPLRVKEGEEETWEFEIDEEAEVD